MKKFIIAIAIITVLAFASGLFFLGEDFKVGLSDKPLIEGTGDVSDSVNETESPGTSQPSIDTTHPSSESEPVNEYSYTINVYKEGTSTLLGTIHRKSSDNSATLRFAGNILYLEDSEGNSGIKIDGYNSIESVSKTVFSPGTYSVYVTLHVHSYRTSQAATCTASGIKICSCGDTVTISATGHEWMPADDCASKAVCDICGVEGAAGPHKDYDFDGSCDFCSTSM